MPEGILYTSAYAGTGIAELQRAVLERICGTATDGADGHVVTSERHRALLQQAGAALARVSSGVAGAHPTEILAVEIRDAAQSLASLLGDEVGEDVLDSLFSRFCIGK